MKNLLKSCLPVILALGMFFYVSCGSDDSGGTKNFGSEAEADAAIALSTAQINLAVSDIMTVANIAGSFGAGKSVIGHEGLAKPLSYTYDAGTGWWTETYSSSSAGYTYNFNHKHRFTPRDGNGYATNTTDALEYGYDYDYYGSSAGYTYELIYNSDMNCGGLVGYRASTGNLTINGTSAIDYDFEFSYGQTYSYVYAYDNTYTNIELSNAETYPVSGSIKFTSKFSLTPEMEGFNNYNVSGKITFTGGNTASLEFGGYHYTINLATGVITPAS